MIEFISSVQLDFMLALGGICGIITYFVYVTETLSDKRKAILMSMELGSMLIVLFDRYAYIYRGDTGPGGYWMVRISNFIVFFMTVFVIHTFDLYFADILICDLHTSEAPKRLKAVSYLGIIGEILVIVSQFTGLYYTFDETNHYQRSSGFILCYLIPILMNMLIVSVIIQYYRRLNRGIRFSLLMFTFLPLVAGVLQIFMYGISLTNLVMVSMTIIVYIYALRDMNATLAKVNKAKLESLTEEGESMKHLFHQTATAFAAAIDAKDMYTRGHSQRVADYSRKIAEISGRDQEECENVYYAGLLHDAGKIAIPDSILQKEGDLTDEQFEQIKQKPIIGSRILAGITEYPDISTGAHHICERYDGSGYPDKLEGDDIPNVARIIAVADAYDTMSSQRSFRDPMPKPVIREELLKASGTHFDPEYVKIMIRLMDSEEEVKVQENAGITTGVFKGELHCTSYRSSITPGVSISPEVTMIRFSAVKEENSPNGFGAPSVIVFDSFDGREHDTYKAIGAYHYLEYGELWFDGHSISTNARNMQVNVTDAPDADTDDTSYSIEAGKYRDHVLIRMTGAGKTVETVIALPDSSKSAFISLTGEYCHISDISVEQTGKVFGEGDIPRIADEISYIDRMTGDVPNIQIDSTRSVTSAGFAIEDRTVLRFHYMSLPAANLVWHCPYILLYHSDDGKVNGPGYREYSLVKLNGETENVGDHAVNSISVEKDEEFTGWDVWKSRCKEGSECELMFRRKGKKITLTTDNLGILINNVTVINDGETVIYAAVTGDQCAITDIRMGDV